MVEELFKGNALIIYLISVVATICYTNFAENQRMFLIVLLTYGTAVFGIFSDLVCMGLLFAVTFTFLEYLSDDRKKLEIITRIDYKFYDYLYLMGFQFALHYIMLAFGLFFLSRSCVGAGRWPLIGGSVCAFIIGEHRIISQRFKIKSITKTLAPLEKEPYYAFAYDERMRERFELLCAFEDKTYLRRTNSYNFFSWEYVALSDVPGKIGYYLSRAFSGREKIKKVVKDRVLSRGYSTPEMQLIRTLGVERGYEGHKIARKIYEIVYSKIVFASLRTYHQENTYLSMEHYREYLLSVYFHTVLTKINGIRVCPFSDAFSAPERIQDWSMEGLFVACMGLSFRRICGENVRLYSKEVEDFGLSSDLIYYLADSFERGEKLPTEQETSPDREEYVFC